MWARVAEIMLGVWLALSPWIFGHAPERTALWVTDLLGGAVIILLALLCWKEQWQKLHLLNAVIGAFLVGSAFLAGTTPPPAYQNHAVVGLLLLMIAVVPSRSAQPPREWQEFYDRNRRDSTVSTPAREDKR